MAFDRTRRLGNHWRNKLDHRVTDKLATKIPLPKTSTPKALTPIAPSRTGETDASALAAAADQASEFLKSLANPVRLRILCLLAQGEAPVGEIAEKLAARQSLISQHLALLRKDGMVSTRRDGQTIHYALADQRIERLIRVLYDEFCPAATG